MKYLFDTDALSAFYDQTHERHREVNSFVEGLRDEEIIYIPVLRGERLHIAEHRFDQVSHRHLFRGLGAHFA